MQHCDVLIIGGGPAGSSCAWGLRDSGLDVLIADRAAFPRHKTCAGWITPPVAEALDLDLDSYGTAHTLQPITGFRTGVIGGGEVETRYESIVSYGIRRCEFDNHLLRRTGTPCRDGEPVKSIEREAEGWAVNGEIHAKVLVGAGGTRCPVAKIMAGGQSPRRRTSLVTAQEVEFEADPADLEKGSVDEDTPELFFCDDLAGYGWCFRKGNFLNIGLGRVDCRDVPQQMTDFYDFLRERKKVLAPLPERRHGHSYYLYEGPPQPMVDDALLLVGDAAGLAYAQSGEGILPAVESGLMAADVIRSAAASGAYTRDSLEPYAERVRNRFGVPRQNSLTQRLPVSWLQKTAASLLATRWFSRHVLLNRWFLHC